MRRTLSKTSPRQVPCTRIRERLSVTAVCSATVAAAARNKIVGVRPRSPPPPWAWWVITIISWGVVVLEDLYFCRTQRGRRGRRQPNSTLYRTPPTCGIWDLPSPGSWNSQYRSCPKMSEFQADNSTDKRAGPVPRIKHVAQASTRVDDSARISGDACGVGSVARATPGRAAGRHAHGARRPPDGRRRAAAVPP